MPIHRQAPAFIDQSTETFDPRHRYQGPSTLLAPYARGARSGCSAAPALADGADSGLITTVAKGHGGVRCSKFSVDWSMKAGGLTVNRHMVGGLDRATLVDRLADDMMMRPPACRGRPER